MCYLVHKWNEYHILPYLLELKNKPLRNYKTNYDKYYYNKSPDFKLYVGKRLVLYEAYNTCHNYLYVVGI